MNKVTFFFFLFCFFSKSTLLRAVDVSDCKAVVSIGFVDWVAPWNRMLQKKAIQKALQSAIKTEVLKISSHANMGLPFSTLRSLFQEQWASFVYGYKVLKESIDKEEYKVVLKVYLFHEKIKEKLVLLNKQHVEKKD